MERIFVYGTLKKGCANHGWLRGAAFETETQISGYLLYNLGPYPAARPGLGAISVESYWPKSGGLALVDELEGYPDLFFRQIVTAHNGEQGWLYLYHRPLPKLPPIPAGEWPCP